MAAMHWPSLLTSRSENQRLFPPGKSSHRRAATSDEVAPHGGAWRGRFGSGAGGRGERATGGSAGGDPLDFQAPLTPLAITGRGPAATLYPGSGRWRKKTEDLETEDRRRRALPADHGLRRSWSDACRAAHAQAKSCLASWVLQSWVCPVLLWRAKGARGGSEEFKGRDAQFCPLWPPEPDFAKNGGGQNARATGGPGILPET
jgi:hypothetical protein